MKGSGFDTVSTDIFNGRLKKATLFVVVVFAALVLRLWFLQLVRGPDYRIQSESNRIHLQDIPSFRGMVFDRNGELLVDNRPSFNLYVIPEEIQNREQLLKSMKAFLGLDPVQVEIKLKKSSHRYPFKPILLKKNISRDELAIIETNLYNLPGVRIRVKPQRHYVYGKLASHVIGYLGEISERELKSRKYPESKLGDLIGKYGVEGKLQKSLNGLRGGEQVEVDAAGRRLQVISRKPPTSGFNISLTIDKGLQMLAERALEGKGGAIVAMNPNNGEVLAMASSPGFDPNDFIEGINEAEWKGMVSSKDRPLQPRAVAGQYPPGSVFKIVVALAGLEEGIINPQEEVTCTGRYTMGSRTYRCWRRYGHGRIDFHRALVESCDVYFYRVGRRLGVDKIGHFARMCGLGKPTDFELGCEKMGLIPTRQWKLKRWGTSWQPGETISTAIGQSFVLVTPVQTARLISAVFNGGYLYRPKVIKWIGKKGKRLHTFSPQVMGELKAKQENLELIKKALIGVVNEPQGTATMARVEEISVAGKTGTAQVVNLETGKVLGKGGEIPLEFRDHAWFAAVAPAAKPSLALAIIVEHGGHGGSSAAPIARQLIAAYLGKN